MRENNPVRLSLIFFFISIFHIPAVVEAVELTGNLVRDGGIEEWITVKPSGEAGSWWQHLTAHKNCVFTSDTEGNLLMPAILAQGSGMKVMQMETEDVHSGKHALRLKEGIYIRVPSEVKDGDIFVSRFWIKGSGTAMIYPTVYGEGRGDILEVKGKPEPGKWALIEERIQATGNKLDAIAFRLVATEESIIDDIFIARVIRPDELKLEEVPADYQERIAFAWQVDGNITLDGKLDEPGWNKAAAFSGFRSYDQQMFLTGVQPLFRILYDEQNLYFGIEIPLPDARQMLDELKNNPLLDTNGQPRPKTDTYTSRESIELFLLAPGRSGYRQFVVSLDGYRYDGSGMDKEWNGLWNFAISVVDDRWFLEMKIPVQDLGIEKTAPAEGWRINLCCNQKRGSSTWAAVGYNFHTPELFGKLIVQDFNIWRKQQPEQRAQRKARILNAAGENAPLYTERLESIELSNTHTLEKEESIQDWKTITRIYSQIDYIGYVYRSIEEELRYRNFFK
ncbi:MAG TPA: hypothetical protein PLQ41_00515 [bacterium]|nr:hypothetical protein [bacterium]HPP29791.1 hypothetical protein [bacterium]